MPIIESHSVFDLGEPSTSGDYMGQLPPRFVHESWSSEDMTAARNAYLFMRPFVLFMRGGATAAIARLSRTFMNSFAERMRAIARMNAAQLGMIENAIRQAIYPLEYLRLPDGRPVQQPFQAFAGQAHHLPALRDLPNIPAAAEAPQPIAKAPQPAAASSSSAAASSPSAAASAV